MWIQKRQSDNRYDLHSKTASGEMPRTECRSIHDVFVDLTKAFDTVSRDGLWKIIVKFGCQSRFIAMVRQFHDGMQARVQNDGEFSEPFEATNGVNQGCIMAPTLFRMMFSAMLMDAFQDSDTGFTIRHRCMPKLMRRLMYLMISSMQMIWIRMSAQGQKCKEPCIKSHSHVITMISQSAPKRQWLYTNQHLQNRTMNQPSL